MMKKVLYLQKLNPEIKSEVQKFFQELGLTPEEFWKIFLKEHSEHFQKQEKRRREISERKKKFYGQRLTLHTKRRVQNFLKEKRLRTEDFWTLFLGSECRERIEMVAERIKNSREFWEKRRKRRLGMVKVTFSQWISLDVKEQIKKFLSELNLTPEEFWKRIIKLCEEKQELKEKLKNG